MNILYEMYKVVEIREEVLSIVNNIIEEQNRVESMKQDAIDEYLMSFGRSRSVGQANRIYSMECTENSCKVVGTGWNMYDLTEPSMVTYDELYTMLSSIEHSMLPSLTQDYIDAENLYGVNAIFLASLSSLESYYGNSDKALYKNNLFGFGSNDYNDKTFTFSTKREGIMYVAKFLSENYLSEDGKYYNGESIYGVNMLYCPDVNGIPKYWSEKIINIANKYIAIIDK